jgi:predicted nucleic acid-binding protein
MILVDTAIWIDHFRHGNAHLSDLLMANMVSVHPWIVGELACDNLAQRGWVLGLVRALPQLPVASEEEMMYFLDKHPLAGRGIGYFDMHLLAAATLASARFWATEEAVRNAAGELGVLYEPAEPGRPKR